MSIKTTHLVVLLVFFLALIGIELIPFQKWLDDSPSNDGLSNRPVLVDQPLNEDELRWSQR